MFLINSLVLSNKLFNAPLPLGYAPVWENVSKYRTEGTSLRHLTRATAVAVNDD